MRKLATLAATLVVAGFGFANVAQAVPPPHAGGGKSSFALLNEPGGDTSVQCGAFKDLDSSETITGDDLPAAFTLYITMGNRSDSGLGGVDGGVRVTYTDGDFVDYPIAAGETVNITMAAGGFLPFDSFITVTSSPGPLDGAVLIGQISLFLDSKAGVPHPFLADNSFCTTTSP